MFLFDKININGALFYFYFFRKRNKRISRQPAQLKLMLRRNKLLSFYLRFRIINPIIEKNKVASAPIATTIA